MIRTLTRSTSYCRSVITRNGDLAVLELDEGATTRDIRTAYRRRAKDCHPDSGGTSQDMVDLTAAAERLLGDHSYVGEVRYNRRQSDPKPPPAPLVFDEFDDEHFGELYAEPNGLKRVLINLVVFPLVLVLIVSVMVLIAT